jgi:hypothetical protein
MVAVFAAAVIAQSAPEPVELYRQFKAGEKLTYALDSHILTEQQEYGFPFFLPQEFDIKYGFTIAVKEMKADGFAEVEYARPTMTFIDGETAETPPKSKTEKVDWRLLLTLSPINEVTNVRDLNPPKPPPGTAKKLAIRLPSRLGLARQDTVGQMIGELHSLALFAGNLDSALDLSPKLPVDETAPGETWKRTVSYQPRELKGTDRQAVQRLDYTYTYDGLVEEGGKRYHRVTGKLSLDTDAAKFINQSLGMKPEQSGLKSLKLKLDTTIRFDLDEKTKHTVRAVGDSTGGFTIEVTQLEGPALIEKITGRTEMRLVSGL